MGLVKINYTDFETRIMAENLNDIQDAILALEDGLFTIDNNKSGEVITITDAYKRGFRSLNIYGKTTQNGTPTPDSPVDLVSAGNSGSITVNVSGENETKGMTIATPNGLPGVPANSASGQQWICDEIDFGRGVYVQRVRIKAFDGTEGWDYSAAGGYFILPHSILRSTNIGLPCCSHFTRGTTSTSGVLFVGEAGFAFYHTSASVSEWKAFLYKQLTNGTPVELAYALATPIETPLSAEELAAYASLHTYKNSTTVSNDAGAWMDLEYVMDAKKYIDRLSISGGGGSSPARLASVTLLASKWVGSGSLYSQVVSIAGITKNSQVNLAPSVEQLSIFYDKDITFVTENDGGVVTVYVIGQKPQNDYTIQADIVEVIV